MPPGYQGGYDMPITGPNAVLRVAGKEDHDIGTINWEISREKSLFVPIGKSVADRATVGPTVFTFSCTVQCKPDGSTGIDWVGWCKNDESKPIVAYSTGRTERFVGCVVDSVGQAVEREAGTWTLDISGKFVDHSYE